jgi:hypothetical protein
MALWFIQNIDAEWSSSMNDSRKKAELLWQRC